MLLLQLFVLAVLVILAITAVANTFTFPRLRAPTPPLPGNLPRVSVLVPARNEAAVIGTTVSSLLQQTYPDYELLVLDDGSTDGTAVKAAAAARGDPRLRIIHGQPLPPGWLGKNWACHQLAQAASGDLLVFTDADVQWQPPALAGLVTKMAQTGAGLLTVWPTQHTRSLAERLVVPLIGMVIMAYLPLLAVHYLPWSIFAAANGQCMAFRRSVYEKVGGHTAVRQQIIEDIALAQRIKQHGHPLRMADGNGLIGCRMYGNWQEVKAGFAKNILAGHGGSVPFLLASTVFHWLVFVIPWLWWLFDGSQWPLVAAGVGIRALSAAITRQRLIDTLFMPVSVLLMTSIAVQAMRWHYSGGPRWKGRVAHG